MVGKEYKSKTKPRDIEGKIAEDKKALKVGVIATVLVGLIAVISLSIRVAFKVQEHFDRYVYKPQRIVILQKPYTKELREQAETVQPWVDGEPVVMDIDTVVENAANPLILRGVHMLESTEGKNDGCLDDGLVNGFGYRQNTFEFVCYPDFRTVASKVDHWYTARLQENGNNLAEALCYYNTGYAGQNSCTYSQNFLTVLAKYL